MNSQPQPRIILVLRHDRVSASQLAHNAVPAFSSAAVGRFKAYDLVLQVPRTAANRNFANHQDLLNHIQNP